jgi:F-type H+-transporting ATPase subunit epsilon
MATMHCEIVTPEGPAFAGEIEMIVVPGSQGELGVLPRHQPIVAHLDVGEIRVRVGAGEWRSFAAADGYFSMQRDRALVLVEAAVPSDAIDVEVANALADDARDRIRRAEEGDESVNRFRAERDLEHAENQIRIAGR